MKVEERGKIYALHKASEKLHDYYGHAMLSVVQFNGHDIKNAYIDGYHQAEKNLELTWKDIKMIYRLVCVVADDLGIKAMNTNIYEEVLKRFKERKDK